MLGKRRLILLTPVLGAGLVIGMAGISQAATASAGTSTAATAGVSAMRVPLDPWNEGYREGYALGVQDGQRSCKQRRTHHRHGRPDMRSQGFAEGYSSGFASICH